MPADSAILAALQGQNGVSAPTFPARTMSYVPKRPSKPTKDVPSVPRPQVASTAAARSCQEVLACTVGHQFTEDDGPVMQGSVVHKGHT